MKIWLDDERPAPAGWVRAYWPEDAIGAMECNDVDVISLDHDLGDDKRGTGYDVLLWLEEAVAVHGVRPPLILVHTANPSARLKMEAAKKKIEELWEVSPCNDQGPNHGMFIRLT
jgi:hypothetical protein